MIDSENFMFTCVRNAVIDKFNDANVVSELLDTPTKFPTVFFQMLSNETYQPTQDFQHFENHVDIIYEISVYYNKNFGKKSQCKEIFKIADNEMQKRGFIRIAYQPMPSFSRNADIFRIVGRWRGIQDNNFVYVR